MLLLAAPAQADTINVDGSAAGGPGCGPTASPCRTVQEGVDAAGPGDTVQVAAGTYEEQVDVAKAISLVGAGIGQTVILSPPAAQLQDKFDFTSTLVEHPIVFVHDTTADISDLTVDGDNRGGVPCDGFYAIAYLRAAGGVDSVRATGITSSPFSGCQTGRAIVNYNFDNLARTWSLTNSTVDDFQKAGIEVRGNNLTSTVAGNTVLGAGPQTDIAQNGIVVRNDALVQGNTVQDLLCNQAACPSQAFSSGILLGSGSAGSEVAGNTLTNVDAAIVDGAPGAREIRDNLLTDNRLYGIITDGTLIAERNLISGSNSGILAESYTSGGPVIADLQATSNNITGNDIGIEVITFSPSPGPPIVDLEFNRIVGNTTGISNTTTGSIDAENNWWGCNAGPGGAGCDTVTGTADFDPWLVLSLAASPGTIQSDQTSDLTAAVNTNSDSASVAGLFPDGIPVGFAASFGAVSPPTDPTSAATAESAFDPQGQEGQATLSATLDNQTVSLPLDVTAVPAPPPADTDGDGVLDADDACPAAVGPASNGGCPLDPPAAPNGACAQPLSGTAAADVLFGSAAGDRIFGRGGADRIRGRLGRDCIHGNRGPDVLRGERWADRIFGGRGVDRLLGGRGRDDLRGGDRRDVIKGGPAADRLLGGSGRDRFHGGSGRDLIISRGLIRDFVRCGTGRDVVRADFRDRVAGDCERVLRRRVAA